MGNSTATLCTRETQIAFQLVINAKDVGEPCFRAAEYGKRHRYRCFVTLSGCRRKNHAVNGAPWKNVPSFAAHKRTRRGPELERNCVSDVIESRTVKCCPDTIATGKCRTRWQGKRTLRSFPQTIRSLVKEKASLVLVGNYRIITLYRVILLSFCSRDFVA